MHPNVLLPLTFLASGLGWALWAIAGIVCRRIRISEKGQLIAQAVAALSPLAILISLNFPLDRLDALERGCEAELMKSERFTDARGFRISKHIDAWNMGFSWGSAYDLGGVAKPHTEPRVLLWAGFFRDRQYHDVSAECQYDRIPNSGDPPELIFRQIKFTGELVYDEQNHLVLPQHRQ